MITQALFEQVVGNAPAVLVLIYLLIRQERVFSEMWDRCLTRIEDLENREIADPSELDFKR